MISTKRALGSSVTERKSKSRKHQQPMEDDPHEPHSSTAVQPIFSMPIKTPYPPDSIASLVSPPGFDLNSYLKFPLNNITTIASISAPWLSFSPLTSSPRGACQGCSSMTESQRGFFPSISGKSNLQSHYFSTIDETLDSSVYQSLSLPAPTIQSSSLQHNTTYSEAQICPTCQNPLDWVNCTPLGCFVGEESGEMFGSVTPSDSDMNFSQFFDFTTFATEASYPPERGSEMVACVQDATPLLSQANDSGEPHSLNRTSNQDSQITVAKVPHPTSWVPSVGTLGNWLDQKSRTASITPSLLSQVQDCIQNARRFSGMSTASSQITNINNSVGVVPDFEKQQWVEEKAGWPVCLDISLFTRPCCNFEIGCGTCGFYAQLAYARGGDQYFCSNLSINVRDAFGNGLLSHAAASNNVSYSFIAHLINAGADINSKSTSGETFMHVLRPHQLASFVDYIKLLKLLKSKDFNFHAKDIRGQTLSHILLRELKSSTLPFGSLVDAFKLLKPGFGGPNNLGRKAVDYLEHWTGPRRISISARESHLANLDQLRLMCTPDFEGLSWEYSRYCRPNLIDSETGFNNIIALLTKEPDTEKSIVEAIGNILRINPEIELNHQDRKGFTALIHATCLGMRLVVEELLAQGANPNLRTYNNKTILDCVNSALKKAVLSQDASLNARIRSCTPPLMQAGAKSNPTFLDTWQFVDPTARTFKRLMMDKVITKRKSTSKSQSKQTTEVVHSGYSLGSNFQEEGHHDTSTLQDQQYANLDGVHSLVESDNLDFWQDAEDSGNRNYMPTVTNSTNLFTDRQFNKISTEANTLPNQEPTDLDSFYPVVEGDNLDFAEDSGNGNDLPIVITSTGLSFERRVDNVPRDPLILPAYHVAPWNDIPFAQPYPDAWHTNAAYQAPWSEISFSLPYQKPPGVQNEHSLTKSDSLDLLEGKNPGIESDSLDFGHDDFAASSYLWL